MEQVVDLGVDRRVDVGMGVAGGDDGDSGVEVEEAVAVDVLDDAAAAAPHDQRVDPGERRAGHGLVARDDRGGVRAGQFGPQVGSSRISREVVSNAGPSCSSPRSPFSIDLGVSVPKFMSTVMSVP